MRNVSPSSSLRLTNVVLLLILCFSFSVADRTKAKIYVDLVDAKGCFRRLSAGGVVGCQSSPNGDVGVVHFFENVDADVDFVIRKGTAAPYIPVMTPIHFTKSTVEQLVTAHENGRISGIVLLGTEEVVNQTVEFSTDAACPNLKYGLYGDRPESSCDRWNQPGSGLSFREFPFPIFLIRNQTERDLLIVKCFTKYNSPKKAKNQPEQTYPLCSIQLDSFMFAGVNTNRCLRRSRKLDISAGSYDMQCDPLGSKNVFGFLRNPHPVPTVGGTMVMVTARMDAFSLFEDVYPGADSPASGIVALLAAAHAVKKAEAKIGAAGRNVIFALFSGEAYDYLGSTRVLYDMTAAEGSRWPDVNGSVWAPVELHDVSHYIELSQLGRIKDERASLFADLATATTGTKEAMDALDSAAKSVNLTLTRNTGQLPPSSLHQFLKASTKLKKDFSGVVFAEHEEYFTNKVYNSFLDLPESTPEYRTALVANLQKVATTTARAIVNLTTGVEADEDVQADADVVDELVECFFFDTNCTLFKQVLSVASDLNKVSDHSFLFSYYVGVYRSQNNIPYFISLLLAKFTGDLEPTRKIKECDGEVYDWMLLDGKGGNGTCVTSFVGLTPALSPAIRTADEDFLYKYDPELGESMAAWTESVWSPKTMKARIFLVPSVLRQATILLVGFAEFLLFMILMYLISRRADILFGVETSAERVLVTS